MTDAASSLMGPLSSATGMIAAGSTSRSPAAASARAPRRRPQPSHVDTMGWYTAVAHCAATTASESSSSRRTRSALGGPHRRSGSGPGRAPWPGTSPGLRSGGASPRSPTVVGHRHADAERDPTILSVHAGDVHLEGSDAAAARRRPPPTQGPRRAGRTRRYRGARSCLRPTLGSGGPPSPDEEVVAVLCPRVSLTRLKWSRST